MQEDCQWPLKMVEIPTGHASQQCMQLGQSKPTLTHWGRVTHICVGKRTIIGPDNDMSPGRHQAIIWTNAWVLLIKTLETNFSDSLIEIQIFWLKNKTLENVSCEMLSISSRPQCVNSLRPSDASMRRWTNHHCFRYWLVAGTAQAIISTNAGILSTRPFGTNLSKNFIKIRTFLYQKMGLKVTPL